ncbi:MAG TPA: NifU family protein [Blastocatellia bacterium]|nr:NifU family protein [Blastocatellia bacterium]
MSSPEIKITAEIQPDPSVCSFKVDRMIYPGKITFTDKEMAKGSALPEALFELEGVADVSFAGREVTVTKQGDAEWLPIAKQVGATIRAKLQSGQALFSEQYTPTMSSISSEELKERVQRVIDEMINPGVAAHGGFVQLIDFKDYTAYVRMGGGCQGCGAADVTLKQGISRIIRDEVPEVIEVMDATDHAGGQNPYYAPAK